MLFIFVKRGGGKMAKYDDWLTEESLIIVEGWARDGLTDKQIAQNMGIGYTTLKDWKKRFPSFLSSLKKGKEVVDRQVENALFKSAVGFHYTEETVTNAGAVVTVTKYSKPNTTAQIFWLKNRKAAWSDQKDNTQPNEPVIIVDSWDDD